MTTSRRGRLALLARAAAVAAAVLMVAGAAPAVAVDDGSLGIRLLDAPEDRRDDPRARVYIVDHLAPGSTITRRVQVSNEGDKPLDVTFYAGPSQIVAGAWSPADRGETSELTSWTTLGRERATVPAGSTLDVPVTIAVPGDASEGERYGVIWAETASSGDQNVQLVSRVGVRVYLSVGPGGEPASSFEITTLTSERDEDGGYRVLAEVANTGGRALDLEGELKLNDGPGGLAAGPYPTAERVSLAPGDTDTVPVVLDGSLPRGPWEAVLTLRSGQLEQKARATLTFPAEGRSDPVTAESADERSPLWYAGGAALVLVVAAASWTWVRRARPSA